MAKTKLRDFPVTNFDGGLVTNRSDYEMDRSMLKNSLNYDLDERGKLKRRRGIQQYGDTKSGTLDMSYLAGFPGTNGVEYQHLIVDRSATNATLYRLFQTYLTTALATSDTSIVCGNIVDFAASGVVEIEGDLIDYTGNNGSTTLTGATGIRVAHLVGAAVNQIRSVGTLTMINDTGAYFAFINGLVFITGRAGVNNMVTFNGTTISAVSDADRPQGLFATNYRERIYVAGAGGTSGNNFQPIRISFSDAGDATSWDVNNFFDVEDDRGESIMGLLEMNDTLLIFKTNSTFAYNEIQLTQRLWNVGAYNHRVIQRIGELTYTFCPSGVYATNGVSAKRISDPVRKYIEHFKPQYSASGGRFVSNCFSGNFENKYYLYLGSVPDPESLSDIVLIYDTQRNNWTVHNVYTSFSHFASLKGFGFGLPSTSAANGIVSQHAETLFAGNSSGQYWRLFDNRILDNTATRTYRGGDVVANLISNDTGSSISTVAETPFFDLGNLNWKEIGYITILVERGDFEVSYRLDVGNTITDWISLGRFHNPLTNKRLHPKYTQGYRISFRIVSNTLDTLSIFNGIIVRDIYATDKIIYR